VVNIGCGLDTTFERVDNGKLRWYDLDLPDTIRLRRQLIQESTRRTFIASSLLEPDWLEQIKVEGNVLFIAAGVFYYFREEEIRGFLLGLADRFPGCQVLFDVCSPYGVKVANKLVIQRSGLDERSFLTWGLESPAALAAWDPRIRILQEVYYFGRRARSLPLNLRLIGRFSDYKKIQYMLHLEMAG
jgi:O-methyltransferase involved in polyketide biosynthesis